ncbi:MAG: sulfurtransferase TusA family protein [Parashewanella sp.]
MLFIDLTQYRCPLPLVKTKLLLKKMTQGEQLQLLLSDPGSRQDVPQFLTKQGYLVKELLNNDSNLHLLITKTQN